jgi:HEAT repeat protein
MALRKKQTSNSDGRHNERRDRARSLEDLLAQIKEPNPIARRWAARDLAAYPTAITTLCELLPTEPDFGVREAMFDTLHHLGNGAVVDGLVPLLRSDDAALRNSVIEVLQALPTFIDSKIRTLLADPDSDVRIFAIDILRAVPHPDAPYWLTEVLNQETHINVIGQALDCLVEIGSPDMIPMLNDLKQRFADQPYICFAVDTVLHRIGSD